MKSSEQQELSALHALGVLAPDEATRLEAQLAQDADARAELADMNRVAAALAQSIPAARPPSPRVRAALLERIQRTPQAPVPAGESAPEESAAPAGFHFLKSHEGNWLATPIPGIRMKVLSVSRDMGSWMVLADLAAGARYPSHEHAGSEQLYVLSGQLRTAGRVLGPGDFLHAEPGTQHDGLYSPDGCVAILVERAPAEMLS